MVTTKTLIMWISLSIMSNVLIIAFLIVTKIGSDVWKRFINKVRYKTGNYINGIIILKTGVIKEIFKPKSPEGSIKYGELTYTTNPHLLMPYKDIPTYIYLEGQPAPINIYADKQSEIMSCSEMDNVMLAMLNFDLREFLKKYGLYIIIVVIAIIGIVAVSAYFGYSNYEMLRDGTFKIAQATVELTPK